jgi:hypothetical protein
MRLLHDNLKKGRQMAKALLLILSGVINSPGEFTAWWGRGIFLEKRRGKG